VLSTQLKPALALMLKKISLGFALIATYKSARGLATSLLGILCVGWRLGVIFITPVGNLFKDRCFE
jgi:hypothetical protein